MKKILVFTYYWEPSGGAGVQRWLKFCKYLPQFGIEPIVITVNADKASYAQCDSSLRGEVSDKLRVERTNTFEIYSWYQKLSPQKEIPYGGFANEKDPNTFQKISRFIRGNFFLPDPRRGWNKYALRKACEIIEAENIDTIVTTSPPHSTQLIGLELKKLYPNIQWVADLRDPWTDIYYYNDLYPTYLADKINHRYEKRVLQQADLVLTVSEGCKRIFALKEINPDKIVVINNGYDEEDFEKTTIAPTNNELAITYTGTMSDLYDISALVTALGTLSKEQKEQVKIRFVGKITPNILNDLKQVMPASQIEVVDYVPHSESIDYLLKSDLLLLVIAKTSENKGIITGKIFEYLAAKKTILCIGPTDGDAAAIINQCQAGETFDYSDSNSITKFLQQQFSDWKLNGKLSVENENYKQFSRKELTKKLTGILNR